MIDFDAIDEWWEPLSQVLAPLLPPDFASRIRSTNPEFMEDARDALLGMGNEAHIVDAVLDWLRSETLVGYHGTRLTDAEMKSVEADGLLPLVAATRRDRIQRALSGHPRWTDVKEQLSELLEKHGPGAKAGIRENQVHLTISRGALVSGFNHYLTHGSEFDQQIARALLDHEGYHLLAKDGQAVVLAYGVPGAAAIKAAHPFFSVEMMRERDELPNLVREFVTSWAWKVWKPEPATQRLDCGLMFREAVPASWMVSAAKLTNEELSEQ